MLLAITHSQGQPLPSNPYSTPGDSCTAYEHCLQLERCAGWDSFQVVEDPFEEIMADMPPVVAARVLGHGLHFAPNGDGRNALVRDILACEQKQPWLATLAHLYVYGLIRVFYNPKGPTPAVTPHIHASIVLGDRCTNRASSRIIV
ncbi:hypothetical protein C8Q76DRAFT_491403 [Earliella scabrosa]|nr:hypothetical protein C8Q76DRAFT_491403 [Earliella scabrosa]